MTYTLFLFLGFSCTTNDGTLSCFPNSTINSTINLNLPQYQNLLNAGGYVETSGASGEGTRGLIIVRTSNSNFKVYDRNAPHLCPDDDTTLFVQSGIVIYCPHDDSKWNLYTGEPISGNTSKSPRTYYASFNPSTNVLFISN
ncbi:MAG: hypothetical protein H6604_05175 [Flavobacteriales bacterium]|nr:hypothetical protein [Flavobacteriales bacterium]